MVIESIITPSKAKRHPLWVLFIGILFAVLGLLFSLWIFEGQASIVMVLLVVLMAVPLMYALMFVEEEEDVRLPDEKSILKEHAKTLGFLSLLFLGLVIGFTLLYVFLPGGVVENVFSAQHEAINIVNENISGSVTSVSSFLGILGNNFKVLVFCVFFAFFFGAGAIFILSWNASVIAAAIGHYIREGLASVAGAVGMGTIASYFHIFASGFLRYLVHGIFEIGAYFVGGLAGGILSVALLRHGFRSKEFTKVLHDVAILFGISLLILIFAGIVEVGITPLLF